MIDRVNKTVLLAFINTVAFRFLIGMHSMYLAVMDLMDLDLPEVKELQSLSI